MPLPSRNEYKWDNRRPFVPDSRVVAKTNDEYHEHQALAGKYAASKNYKGAVAHFRKAYDLRKSLMDALPQLQDEGHLKAKRVVAQLHNYYKALYVWQESSPKKKIPRPEDFNLERRIVEKVEVEGRALLIQDFKRFVKLAGQYAATSMYKSAASHFRMAYDLRKAMLTHFPQLKTEQAIVKLNTVVRLLNYYNALALWQQVRPINMNKVPQPVAFKLTQSLVEKIEKRGQEEVEAATGITLR